MISCSKLDLIAKHFDDVKTIKVYETMYLFNCLLCMSCYNRQFDIYGNYMYYIVSANVIIIMCYIVSANVFTAVSSDDCNTRWRRWNGWLSESHTSIASSTNVFHYTNLCSQWTRHTNHY